MRHSRLTARVHKKNEFSHFQRTFCPALNLLRVGTSILEETPITVSL